MIFPSNNQVTTTINHQATTRRHTMPEKNNFSISELSRLPPYFGEVAIQNNLGYMYLGGSDCGTALRLLWNGQYEPSSIEIWEKLCKKAGQIYDLGAHTGIYTISAANACQQKNNNASAFIHSFEPYIVNFVRLKLNSKLNGIQKISNINQLAISDKNGEVEMHIPLTANDYNSAGPTLQKAGLTTKNYTSTKVLSISIDYYINSLTSCQYLRKDTVNAHCFDLFKIDVEGNEPEVLKGMTNKLSLHPPIILIECVNDEPTNETSKILKNSGYRFYRINESNNKLIRVDELIVMKSKMEGGAKTLDRNYLNALCIPEQIKEHELITLLSDV